MKKIKLLWLLSSLLLGALALATAIAGASEPVLTDADARWRMEQGLWRVHRVVDGDTIVVQRVGGSATHTVRLLGIDAPEIGGFGSECGGRQATAKTLALTFSAPVDRNGDGVLDHAGGRGAVVSLQTDGSLPVYDDYSRVLAYVQLVADLSPSARRSHRDLGKSLIAAGLAVPYDTGLDFVRRTSYEYYSAAARFASRGSWTRCGDDFFFEGG